MTSSNWLVVFIVATLGLAAYLLATAPGVNNDELDEMEEDWWL
jgi:hypothetical protein